MVPRALLALALALCACESPRPELGSPVSGSPRRLHAEGIQDPDSARFHGALVRNAAYDLDVCRGCHGADLSGGAAESSCLECHEDGPDDCGVCHGDLRERGAHAAHLEGGRLERPTACETCHVVPDSLLSPGHVVVDGALDPPPVEVRLAGDARAPAGGPAPTYAAGSCQDVYCHGVATPAWTDPGPLDCDGCHGDPPAEHPDGACGRCHRPTTDRGDALAQLGLHLDRAVQLGEPELGCGGCHGGADGAAPAPDLAGRVARTEVTVGLHAVHLEPRLGLGPPVACDACHLVPAAVDDPGHLDDGPAEVVFGGLAVADGARPSWDRETATCAGTYCHGGGDRLGAETTPAYDPDVVWNTPTVPQVFCGTCHGAPPGSAIHRDVGGLSDCARCHAGTVDAFGNVRPDGAHLNGSFDADG